MKTKQILFLLLLGYNLTFGQATVNQSVTGVASQISNPNNSIGTPLGPQFGSEIFRFRTGLVTQLDSGNAFNFTSSQWFAQGRLTAGTQTFYGLRFQQPNKSLLLGYSSASPINPIIQWIGTGPNLGNLEFRVANTFGAINSPGANRLVATMTSDGNTCFGDFTPTNNYTKVTIKGDPDELQIGLDVSAEVSLGNDTDAIGVLSTAKFGAFTAAYVGNAPNTLNSYAGYFNGKVFITGSLTALSDSKFKNKIKIESNVLDKIDKLQPVTYNYNVMKELNLPEGMQHGFIAQEIAQIFPELTEDIKQPIFDENGKTRNKLEFKSVNYIGLISVLTAGIKELNTELKVVKEKLTNLEVEKKLNSTGFEISKKAFMEQNIPNPFSDQTIIRFQLPINTSNADIMVTDLNGKRIKIYPIRSNQSEITIKASEIGSGLFIYSLIQNGQELITKKLIIK